MENVYDYDFYKDRHQKTVYSAEKVLSLIFAVLPEVHSAVDFGCGVGSWLSVVRENGVREVLGLDGPWVNQGLLEISAQEFQQVDFEEFIDLEKKFDLAITLEVAEHLSEKSAPSFVKSLTKASDFILFSAAIPFQGGRGHINMQWQDYWVNLFADRGFVVLDFVRKQIWHETQIPVHYRQNTLMFVRREAMQRVHLTESSGFDNNLPISLVHPEMYLKKIKKMSSLKGSSRLFLKALKNSLIK
jgi:cyclopropane fatty-acyl-phospholipid synthase-like methyltransferase